MAGIQVSLRTRSQGIYCPVSKLQFAPPPTFCMISLGSIVQRNLEMLSMLEPAAPSEGTPAAAAVAPISLASRPVSVRLRDPKVSSQLRCVISTLLTRQTTVSASTEIFVSGVKPKRRRRVRTRFDAGVWLRTTRMSNPVQIADRIDPRPKHRQVYSAGYR